MLRNRLGRAALGCVALALCACGGGGGDSGPKVLTARDVNVSTNEDVVLTSAFNAAGPVNPISYTIVTAPTQGTVVLGAGNAFTYTPTPNANGSDQFSYQASDGTATSTATVRVQIVAVNDVPIATADALTTRQNTRTRVDVTANDSDVESTAFTVAIVEPPAAGSSATVDADGAIQFDSGSFIGTTQLKYRITDGGGSTAESVLTIESKLRTPLVFTVRTGQHPNFTYAVQYADGLQTVSVASSHPTATNILQLTSARNAPVACFLAAQMLYCADFRDTTGFRLMTQRVADAGTFVAAFYISVDGRRIAYQDGNGMLWMVEMANPATHRAIAPAGPPLVVSADLKRVAYADVRFTPSLQPSRVYFLDTDTGVSTPISPYAQPPAMISSLRMTLDGERVYYMVESNIPAVGGVIMSVDPTNANDSFMVFDNAPLAPNGISLKNLTTDGLAFYEATAANRGSILKIGSPGSLLNFTDGTPSAPIYDYAVNHDASRAYYLRADLNGLYSLLYAVDMTTPSISTRIGTQPAGGLGVSSFALSRDETRIAYATTELVQLPGGSTVPGNSRLYVLSLTDGSISSPIASANALSIDDVAPDGGVVLVEERGATTFPRLHALNLLDPTQLIRLDDSALDVGANEHAFVNGLE